MKKIIISILIMTSNYYGFSQNQILKVWPDKVPGSIVNNTYLENPNDDPQKPGRISKVSEPTISVFLPEKNLATGTAIVICPGGGYGRLAFDHEGIQIAKWLNTHGIAGIILKYRLPSDLIMEDKKQGPLQDVQEAIRITRRNAKKWNIDPAKIGVMGFSAGGHLAATASTLYGEKVYNSIDSTSARPDFSALIYPVISMKKGITHLGSRKSLLGENPDTTIVTKFSNENQVTKQTPPAFLVHSADDKAVPVENSIAYFLALKQNNIPAELHIFEKGGHGYGMSVGNGTQSAWPELLIKWLKAEGFQK